MGPPKPKSKQQAMPSMLKSMQRSVTVASAAVDTALGAGTTGVGQRSSVVAASAAAGAQERHSLLANDGMTMDVASPDRPGSMSMGMGLGMNMNMTSGSSETAPKLMKMSSRHIRMKKMMDSIGTRLKLHARGDNIAFGRRDRADASGKSYNVEIPKNMIVLTLIAFFVVPLAFGLWVLFRQLFMSEETHSRYGHQQHHQQHHHSSSEFRASHHPDAFHVTSGGNGTATEAAAVDSMGNATVSDGLVDLLVAEEKRDPAALAKTKAKSTATALTEGEANKEEETQDIKASPSGDQDDAPIAKEGNVETKPEESDANDGDNGQSSEEEEKKDTAEEANAEANGSEALPSSEVTKDKAEPPDSDDQEEEDDDSNVSEAEGEGADGDADKDSATEEGLPGSNNDEKGGAETQDNADLEENEGGESSA